MRKCFTLILLTLAMTTTAQNYENQFTRPLHDVMADVEKRFGIRLKYDMDTTGLQVKYADFRIRPYSVEETLSNLLAPLDFKPVFQQKNVWKVKRYEYPRRQPEDGEQLIAWLGSLYDDRSQWETRSDTLRCEVIERLGITPLLKQRVAPKPDFTEPRLHDGYMVQNFRCNTTPGHTVCGSVYMPLPPKGKKARAKASKRQLPLIICPNGHFSQGRYNADLQKRYATLARMGAICVSYDLWGWGESADEVGSEAHHTSEAHVMQALNGVTILDLMLDTFDCIDTTRIGVNGGSGGGTQAVLLSVIDPRYTALCPVVSISSWFDGGCPCESGMPIQLSGGGTCNVELAAMFAPKPMLVVSDGGDWTSTTPTLEYPYLWRIYNFYGASHQVNNVHLPDERHDFGPNKRQAVYDFFIRTFRLDASKLDESKVTIEEEKTLRIHTKHVRP